MCGRAVFSFLEAAGLGLGVGVAAVAPAGHSLRCGVYFQS